MEPWRVAIVHFVNDTHCNQCALVAVNIQGDGLGVLIKQAALTWME